MHCIELRGVSKRFGATDALIDVELRIPDGAITAIVGESGSGKSTLLLPILRNTITALLTIDPLLKRVAEAMGLTRSQQIRHVLLPLSMPNVMAGIRTAAVISIGTATLAAFIGAGGLGEPIVTGLALNDVDLILQGAVPAALLALLTELAFELLERRLVPEHMLSGKLPE